jgi:hypothetical protein
VRIAQTSRPERTRSLPKLSLPNLDLKPSYKYFGVSPSFDFGWVRRFEEEFDSLPQIRTSRLDGIAGACEIEFGAEPDLAAALSLHDRRKLLEAFRGCDPRFA